MLPLNLCDYPQGITAIDTHYERPWLDASHLIVDHGRAAFVDTGTSHSVPILLAALAAKGLSTADVDYVLLTHIHLDHAGGAGALLQHLPNATCVIHPRGVPHMVDPEILIASTQAVYGDATFARLYGQIVPIPAPRIIASSDGMTLTLGQRQLTLFDTPGHALHHYCIYDSVAHAVFSGDTFGVSYRELDTANGAFILPATTPTHFDPVALHASIDRILSFQPSACFLTHFGRVQDVSRLAATLHREIDAFVAIARDCAQSSDGSASPQRAMAIKKALLHHHRQRLADHGVSNPDQAVQTILGMDLELDAQGLDVWLARGKQ